MKITKVRMPRVLCAAGRAWARLIRLRPGGFDAPPPAFFTSEKVVAGTMSEPFVVASCAASFGVFTHEPVERLEAAGCVVKVNPLGRAMKDLEMIKFAADADAIILGNAE